MDFKKLALATMVAAALAGCNSDDDNSTSDIPAGARPGRDGIVGDDGTPGEHIEAFFFDSSPVKGAKFDCGDESATSEKSGRFVVPFGESCVVSIDGFVLGKTEPLNSQNRFIISSHLQPVGARMTRMSENSVTDFNLRVSSLLQSIDADQNEGSFIDTRETDGSTIPAGLLTEEATEEEFIEKLQNVEVGGGALGDPDQGSGSIIPPSEAGDNLTNNYESEAVKRVISQVLHLLSNHEMEIHIENELRDIRRELQTSDGSNHHHQQALLAILEILEVVNSREVSNRIDITGNLFDYTQMLPKVLDATFNKDADVLFKGELGTTDDIAEILFDSARRLVAASQRLGSAFPNEDYVLPYEELSISYHDALYLRASALNVANIIAITSAYSIGDERLYVPQEFTESGYPVHERWYDSDTRKHEVALALKDFEGEYTHAFIDQEIIVHDPEVLMLRSNPKYMALAKQALTESLPLIKELEIDEETSNLIESLDAHLHAEDGDRNPLVIEDGDDEIFINLHAFYDTENGIDRNSFTVNFNGYHCSGGMKGQYDETLSKLFNDTICSHDENVIIQEDYHSWIDWNRVRYIGWYTNNNGDTVDQFIPAVYASADLDISPEYDITRVAWCGMEDNGDKISCFD